MKLDSWWIVIEPAIEAFLYYSIHPEQSPGRHFKDGTAPQIVRAITD